MSFEFETIDDLPSGGRANTSDLVATIDAIKLAVEEGKLEAGKWTVLKVGDNKESIAATTSNLRDRYGEVSNYGLSFAARPYHKDAQLRAIYVSYEPDKIVEGHAAKHNETRAAKNKAAAERAKVRAAEKAKAEARKVAGDTVPASKPAVQKAS